jgi:MacB-like periplasmic core domain
MKATWRGLRKSPLFALTAAMTIVVGIGASTAIFSAVNAVILRPLPYRDSDRLTLVFWENHEVHSRSLMYSNADFSDLAGGTREIFEDIGGITSFRAFLTREDKSAEQIQKALITTNFFRLMGARIALGRDFNDADATPQPTSPDVLIPPGSAVILSHEYWQRRYGSRASVIGEKMTSGPTIVGVLTPGFRLYFPAAERIDPTPDFYVANNLGYDAAHRNLMTVNAIGRLRRGLTLDAAQQRLNSLRIGIRKNSFDREATLRLEPMGRYLADDVRPSILALLSAVLFLLLIGCANVANLMLVRAAARERELAVRAALGGSWWRIAGEILAEASLIAGAGTIAGVGLAWVGIHALVSIAPPDIPRLDSVNMDWRVLAFAIVAGAISTATFGMTPAIRASRPDVNRILRGSSNGNEGRLLRNAVIIGEVALSFVLLVGSGLIARSFLELRRVDPGFDPRGVLSIFITRDWPLNEQKGRIELLREIQARLKSDPSTQCEDDGYCYYTQAVWTANANGHSGTPTWYVLSNESGGNVSLNCNPCNSVTATSTSPSNGCVYDVTVYVVYPDMSQSPNFDVAIIQPTTLTYQSVVDEADGSSDGWQSNTTWGLTDACGNSDNYLDFNEGFGTISVDYSGENWSDPSPSTANSGSSAIAVDMMSATGPDLSPQAENPQSPLGSTAVYHNPWLFYVGSPTLCTGSPGSESCTGLLMFTDTQQRYLDHGRHQ